MKLQGKVLLSPHQNERSQNRAGQCAQASQERYQGNGHVKERVESERWRDGAIEVRVYSAYHADEESGDDEGDEFEWRCIDPQPQSSILVIANCQQSKPVFGVAHPPRGSKGKQQDGKADKIERQVVEISTPVKWYRQAQPCRTIGDVAQVIGHQLHNEESGNRNDDKGMPARAQRNPSEWNCEDSGHQARKRDKEERGVPRGNVPILGHESDSIRANAEISGMAKRNIAAVARKDIPACRCRRVEDGEDCYDGHSRV